MNVQPCTSCPQCLGDGGIADGREWIGCDECDGTGVVTVEHAKDLRAVYVAIVDQCFANLRSRGRIA